MEQLDYNLLFRWFVGLNIDDAVWDGRCSPRTASVCSNGDIAEASVNLEQWESVAFGGRIRSRTTARDEYIDGRRGSKAGHYLGCNCAVQF